MHTLSSKFHSRRLAITVGPALAASLVVIPRAAAQQAGDSVAPRPTSLGAIVIAATRTNQSIRSLPAHVVVVGTPAIAASAAQTVPDLLRTMPGFTTRDFQSGLVSSPSQSIVSFRGLGGSSAGRTLVLLDGVPAGDPFSGWLDWGRIPLPLLESAEVIRGGGSTVWGSRSLGGVINLRTVSARDDALLLMLEGGSLGTVHAAGSGSLRRGRLSATIGADGWETDGFILLPPDQAGPIDRREARISRALSGRATWDASQALQFWAGGGAYAGGDPPIFDEDRERFDEGRGGLRWIAPSGGIATVAAFTNRRSSRGRSWSINSDRTAQTPQRSTVTPANSSGLSLQWTQLTFGRHEVTVGADLSTASGALAQQFDYDGDDATREREVGGAQQIGGVFLQDAADIGQGVRMVASVRADRLRNRDGRRIVRDLDLGSVVFDSALTGLASSHVTWSVGLRWQQADWFAWRGNVYEAFRAPSMYEMYYARFSSRGTVTEANAELDAERLRGAELGADMMLGTGFTARITGYTNRISSPIMDVTIGTAGDQAEVIEPCGLMPARQTCGQRQNVEGLRSNGIETEVEWQPSVTQRVSLGYAFSATRISAPGEPVNGLQAIRSARHMATSSVAFQTPGQVGVAIDARYVGPRFDDDLNIVELADFYLVGLRLNRRMGRGITAHLKIENLLDEVFEVARTRSGLADMGPPRWVTVGMRATW